MYNTLIILDDAAQLGDFSVPGVIEFERYLREYPKRNEGKVRLINLCDTQHYLSRGYYCSLLAEARRHTVLPSLKSVNELRRGMIANEQVLPAEQELVALFGDQSDAEVLIYFGATEHASLKRLASKLFKKYPAPILRLTRSEQDGWVLDQCSYSQLSDEQRKIFQTELENFIRTVWRINPRKKRYRWDMAILVNPEEPSPPSDKEALARFVKAAGKHGINAELVTAKQISNVAQYDALFIRETTAIDHHTYRLARKAEEAGVVVIDDPDSILRCCNKIYLQDAFSYQNVPSLRAEVVNESSDAVLDALEEQFTYPMVLKMPEGSFSRGVFKVADRDKLRELLDKLLAESALVLVQEYLYTEFDWRIGILNGRAVYACRYLMARNHWQIYNHEAKKRFVSGDFETLPTFEVPKVVLDAALKACAVIGKGLYGVDIKQRDNHAYVLEVNDNPSIEHKVEDLYLGDELYMQIMSEFQRRLEARGRE